MNYELATTETSSWNSSICQLGRFGDNLCGFSGSML